MEFCFQWEELIVDDYMFDVKYWLCIYYEIYQRIIVV